MAGGLLDAHYFADHWHLPPCPHPDGLFPDDAAVAAEAAAAAAHGTEGHCEADRFYYMKRIADRIKLLHPSATTDAAEKGFYHDAFKSIVHALVDSESDNYNNGGGDKAVTVDISFPPIVEDTSTNQDVDARVVRKNYLNKILALLHFLERVRVYGPPADHEIMHYRDIKKHVWSMMARNEATRRTPEGLGSLSRDQPAITRNYTCLKVLDAYEELEELDSVLVDISRRIQESNNREVPGLKLQLVVKTDFTAALEDCQDNNNCNAYYFYKLALACCDLQSSGLVFAPPSNDEKKSFTSLIDHPLPDISYRTRDNHGNSFTNTGTGTQHLYFDQKLEIHGNTSSFKRRRGEIVEQEFPDSLLQHLLSSFIQMLMIKSHQLEELSSRIISQILEKLEIDMSPESLLNHYFENEGGELPIQFKNRKSASNSAEYMRYLDQCLLFLHHIDCLVYGVIENLRIPCGELNDGSLSDYSKISWEAALGLPLLQSGVLGYVTRNECPSKQEPTKQQHTIMTEGPRPGTRLSACSGYIRPVAEATIICQSNGLKEDTTNNSDDGAYISGEDRTNHVKILKGIVQVLEAIETLDTAHGSDAMPGDDEEDTVLDRILENVSFCIDFFLCAKAYEYDAHLKSRKRSSADLSGSSGALANWSSMGGGSSEERGPVNGCLRTCCVRVMDALRPVERSSRDGDWFEKLSRTGGTFMFVADMFRNYRRYLIRRTKRECTVSKC